MMHGRVKLTVPTVGMLTVRFSIGISLMVPNVSVTTRIRLRQQRFPKSVRLIAAAQAWVVDMPMRCMQQVGPSGHVCSFHSAILQ
jgi:hypothetical protein